MRQHRVVGLALLTLVCALEVGCVYHRTDAYVTHTPRIDETIPAIASLQIAGDQVHVAADTEFELITPNGERLRKMGVRRGESFQIVDWRTMSTYKLRDLEDESAIFEVERDFMYCQQPNVKYITFDLIRVRPYKAN